MRSAIAWLVLFVLAWITVPAQTQGAAPAWERVQLAGHEYVRLSDWSKSRGFSFRWVKRDETLQLVSPLGRVTLSVDSREAQVNGMQIWLLHPVAAHKGAVFISALDLQNTLQPVFWPPHNRPGSKVRAICLDPGHGGKDPGNRALGQEEKRYTLLLAQELRRQLLQAGLKVILTRTTDAFIDLPVRPDIARRQGADLFVSLHFNGTDNAPQNVQGAEVYCLTPVGACSTNAQGEGGESGRCYGNRYDERNFFLAYQTQRALLRNLKASDRGVRRARFAVLRDATVPAMLVEAGFMSHPAESRKILDSTYRQQIARAIVQGILAYKRQVEVR